MNDIEPSDVSSTNLTAIALLLKGTRESAADSFSHMLLDIASDHRPKDGGGDECQAMCMNEGWPCASWSRAENAAVRWLIEAYTRATTLAR